METLATIFTAQDWKAFAGCEPWSDHEPFIRETAHGCLVGDSRGIGFYTGFDGVSLALYLEGTPALIESIINGLPDSLDEESAKDYGFVQE